MSEIVSRHTDVHGIRTHYLEGGRGRDIVLLHSGEYGASAALCWEKMLPDLAERHHVIAPDWLGYGDTDKIYDFAGGTARRVWHMTEFLATVLRDGAIFIGASMGGSTLARVAAQESPPWPMDAIVLLSGGGFAPLNEHRQALLAYDGTPDAMRRIMEAIMEDATWAVNDDTYIQRRVAVSHQPGAWECTSAPRFKNPQLPPRSQFGNPDETRYELVRSPVLLIAGARDKLRAGFNAWVAGRTLRALAAAGGAAGVRYETAELSLLGESTSKLEKRADEADRYVNNFLKCTYLRERIGQTFHGLITTVVDFGCFVQILEVAVDGLLHVDRLTDDSYEMEADGHGWVGRRHGRRLRAGGQVKVVVTAVNPIEGLIDLELVEE